MEFLLAIIGFFIGMVVGSKIIIDDYKKKLNHHMRPFIGKTGSIEWSDD